MKQRACRVPALCFCRHVVLPLLVSLGSATGVASAAYKDDILFTALASQLGTGLPDGTAVPVSHVEATVGGNPQVYLPDLNDAQFAGKTIVDVTNNSGGTSSGHATSVGRHFYGLTTSMAPGIGSINAYSVDGNNGWLFNGYLRAGQNSQPLSNDNRIANHSWVGTTSVLSNDSQVLRRVDWVIGRDEFIQVVGATNSAASVNPNLLSAGFNVIAVGRTDGGSGVGVNAIDADYTGGRTRPEIVAPLGVTSTATPVVAAAAALLVETGHAVPALSTDPSQVSVNSRSGTTIYNAERSETIKAALMAGADRFTANSSSADIADYRALPANRSANGLDTRFGAGQVNVYNSYHIVTAGEQNSSEDGGVPSGNIGSYGFDYDPSFGGTGGSNNTASYYFSSGSGNEVLKATLAWNININGGSFFFDGTATLYDLDLALYDVTGTQVLVASSDGSLDNSETIWLALPPNRDYMLRVERKGNFNWDYALAWHIEPDTDGDGIGNNADPDDDNDGLPDTAEAGYGTDPLLYDTDGDGFSDGDEVALGYDPASAASTPEWGDLNNDGVVDTADVLLASRAALGDITLTPTQEIVGIIAPLVGGVPQPAGGRPFGIGDLLLIQRKALGDAVF